MILYLTHVKPTILVTWKRTRKLFKLLPKGSKRKMNLKIEEEPLALIEGMHYFLGWLIDYDSLFSQKLLNRPMSSTNSPFEQSVRGAAYIYTSKSGSKSIRPPPVGPVPQPPSDQPSSKLESGSPNSNSHRPPSASSTAITTTASEAIKLALKKLSERNLHDKETQRVSETNWRHF